MIGVGRGLSLYGCDRVWRNRAFIYIAQSDSKNAIDDIDKGLELASNVYYLLMCKAILMIKVGMEIEKGFEVFEKAINEFRIKEKTIKPNDYFSKVL